MFSATVDILLASGLLIAFVLQSTYIPRPLGQCHNARDWIPAGTTRSIFTVLAMESSTDHPNISEIGSKCKSYVIIWACEIPML